MTRRYWLKVDGRKLYDDTLGAVQKAAQRAANQLGRAVQIGYDDAKPRRRAKLKARRNPVMAGHDYTGEEWKLTASGPHGQTGVAYCGTEREARDTARVLRARGFRVTHIVRLRAPNLPFTAAKARRRARRP